MITLPFPTLFVARELSSASPCTFFQQDQLLCRGNLAGESPSPAIALSLIQLNFLILLGVDSFFGDPKQVEWDELTNGYCFSVIL